MGRATLLVSYPALKLFAPGRQNFEFTERFLSMAKIAFVGGGSYGWMPSILGRLLQTPSCQDDEIVIMDVNAEAAEEIYQLALGLRRRGC